MYIFNTYPNRGTEREQHKHTHTHTPLNTYTYYSYADTYMYTGVCVYIIWAGEPRSLRSQLIIEMCLCTPYPQGGQDSA